MSHIMYCYIILYIMLSIIYCVDILYIKYHVTFRFVYETERFNGVAELLEILGR